MIVEKKYTNEEDATQLWTLTKIFFCYFMYFLLIYFLILNK